MFIVTLSGWAWASPIKRVVGQVHWRPSWTVVVRSIFDLLWSPLIGLRSAFALCIDTWPAARILCLHVTLLVLPACACTLASLVPRIWAACMGRPRWHALFKEPRPVVYVQILLGDPDMFMYLGLQRRISACRGIDACASLCIATARLRASHVCLLYWKYRLRFMYMYMNFTAGRISMHGKGVCTMSRATSRVHVHHQKDQDPGKFHIARLHCILLSVVCYAARNVRKHFFQARPRMLCIA